MAGRILRARPGLPAEDLLASAITRSQAGDPLAPVTVVVRSPVVALDLRRRLAERGAFAGPRFVPMSRLTELLGAPEAGAALAGGRPLTAAALGAAVRVALSTDPGVLAGVADHPATEESLARTYRMLRPLTAPERARVASMSQRAHDVVSIVATARELLARTRYDLEDLTLAAADGLERGDVELESVGAVVVHLPDPLSRSQVRLLEALASRGDVTVIAGRLDDPAGDRAVDNLVADLVARGFEMAPGERAGRGPIRLTEAMSAPDFEEEVRLAVRLLAAHAEAGGTLGNAAVAVPASAAGRAYLGVVQELFTAAGIDWTGPPHETVAETPEGRLVLDLIEMLGATERRFDRTAVIRWLSSPAVSSASSLMGGRSFESSDGSIAVPVGEFDRCSRSAGVVAGHDEWGSRLSWMRARAEERSDDSPAGRAADDLLRIVDRLARFAEEMDELSSWQQSADWAVKLVQSVVAPGEEQDRLSQALVSLGELSELEPLAPPGEAGDASLRRLQLSSALAAALATPTASRGRLGVGPLVGTITQLAGIRSELLIVLGCREGVWPARTPDDPLVTEIEREAVRVLSERERIEQRDRRTTLTLLAGADRSVALYPRVDRGASRLTYPSRWLVGDLFEGRIDEIASFPAAISWVAEGRLAAADSFDLELASLVRGVSGGRRVARSFVRGLDDLGRRIDAERSRAGSGLSRFGGHVGPSADDVGVFDDVVSATRIESLAKCPLRFMLDRVLKVKVLEAPDRLDSIAPMERGSLIHEVLERFVEETAVDRERFTGWQPNDFDRLHEIAADVCAKAESRGLTGKPLYWQMERAQIFADLDRFVELESKRLAEVSGRPVRTEYAFGSGEAPPLVIAAGSRSLRFQGKIDRIDSEAGGVVRVVDYKSGGAKSYAGMNADPLGRGQHLQLPIYAKAAADLLDVAVSDVVAEYRFCSASGGFTISGVALTDDLETEFSRVLGVLAGTIDEGTFPPRPGPGDEGHQENCRYCDYESICRLDRAALWDRATTAPQMAEYVALVDTAAVREAT